MESIRHRSDMPRRSGRWTAVGVNATHRYDKPQDMQEGYIRI